MNQTHSHDLIISGGGMVGLAFAVAAAQAGINVALIEKQPSPNIETNDTSYAPRVSALNHASERLLKALGAWDNIPQSRLSAYQNMNVWDGLGKGRIEFNAHSVSKAHLGHIIENRFITQALWERVFECSNIDIITGDSVNQWSQTDNRVNVETSKGRQLTAEVLVSCEGKHSLIRAQSNIETWHWDYGHTAIVTTVEHEKPHHNTANQVFTEHGPLAFLPLKSLEASKNVSSIVWSVRVSEAEALLGLIDEAFKSKLNQAFEKHYGEIISVDARHSFPLTAQHAKSYRDNRVVVLGDAAHSIHPLAGLGVNIGFLDAAALVENLSKSKAEHIDLGHEHGLRRYQRQRQTHNLAVAGVMEGLKRLYDTQAPMPVIARNIGLEFINNSQLLKRPLVLGALGDFGTQLPDLCRG
jgi:2-octaprenylphenol hydroxylase